MTPARLSWQRADALAGLALLLAVAWLCRGMPVAYWRADDPALLLHALQTPAIAAFSDPARWQQLSPSNLTPWVTLSFQIDLALAGLAPAAFYAHQALSAALLAGLAYGLARQVLPPAWAAGGVLAGLLGAPTAAVVEALMTRHYLEGACFTLLSIIAARRAWQQGPGRAAWAWAAAGALAYALACSAKEVYVPLVLVLPALAWSGGLGRPSPGQRHAWPLLLPWGLVALAYVPWRRHMLGATVGGYGEGAGLLAAPQWQAFGRALLQLPQHLLGPAGWPLLALLLAAGGLALLRQPPGRRLAPGALVVVVLLAVLGPLLPLAVSPGLQGPDRYLFLPWWVLCAAGAAALRAALVPRSAATAQRPGWASLRARAAVAALASLAVIAAALVHTLATAPPRAAAGRAFDAVGRFVSRADARQAFVAPPEVLAAWWYVSSLCALRASAAGPCPAALIKGWPLPEATQALWVYEPASGRMVEAPGRLAAARRQAEAIDRSQPLQVALAIEGGYARWRLGPYTEGQYFLVSPELGRYPLPREGQLRTTWREAQFQVQHQAPDGRVTASPTLQVAPGRPVAWARGPGAAPPGSGR